MDVCGVAIARRDLGPALGALVGQRRLVVRPVFPFDGDHVAVMTGVACGDLCFVEFVPPRFVQFLRIREVALRDQLVFDALIVTGLPFFQARYVPVMDDVAFFGCDHPVVMTDVTPIDLDFTRAVAN